MKIARAFLLFYVLFGSAASAAQGRKALSVESNLGSELNRLLQTASLYQMSCYQQDQQKILRVSETFLRDLERAHSVLRTVATHERLHLERTLLIMKARIELIQTSFGESRRQHLKDLFEQTSNIARTYEIDSRFQIFFCSKDRSSWVQTGTRAQNPVNPESLGDCGKAVEK